MAANHKHNGAAGALNQYRRHSYVLLLVCSCQRSQGDMPKTQKMTPMKLPKTGYQPLFDPLRKGVKFQILPLRIFFFSTVHVCRSQANGSTRNFPPFRGGLDSHRLFARSSSTTGRVRVVLFVRLHLTRRLVLLLAIAFRSWRSSILRT